MLPWIGIALFDASWLPGLGYYHLTDWLTCNVLLAAGGAALLAGTPGRRQVAGHRRHADRGDRGLAEPAGDLGRAVALSGGLLGDRRAQALQDVAAGIAAGVAFRRAGPGQHGGHHRRLRPLGAGPSHARL